LEAARATWRAIMKKLNPPVSEFDNAAVADITNYRMAALEASMEGIKEKTHEMIATLIENSVVKAKAEFDSLKASGSLPDISKNGKFGSLPDVSKIGKLSDSLKATGSLPDISKIKPFGSLPDVSKIGKLSDSLPDISKIGKLSDSDEFFDVTDSLSTLSSSDEFVDAKDFFESPFSSTSSLQESSRLKRSMSMSSVLDEDFYLDIAKRLEKLKGLDENSNLLARAVDANDIETAHSLVLQTMKQAGNVIKETTHDHTFTSLLSLEDDLSNIINNIDNIDPPTQISYTQSLENLVSAGDGLAKIALKLDALDITKTIDFTYDFIDELVHVSKKMASTDFLFNELELATHVVSKGAQVYGANINFGYITTRIIRATELWETARHAKGLNLKLDEEIIRLVDYLNKKFINLHKLNQLPDTTRKAFNELAALVKKNHLDINGKIYDKIKKVRFSDELNSIHVIDVEDIIVMDDFPQILTKISRKTANKNPFIPNNIKFTKGTPDTIFTPSNLQLNKIFGIKLANTLSRLGSSVQNMKDKLSKNVGTFFKKEEAIYLPMNKNIPNTKETWAINVNPFDYDSAASAFRKAAISGSNDDVLDFLQKADDFYEPFLTPKKTMAERISTFKEMRWANLRVAKDFVSKLLTKKVILSGVASGAVSGTTGAVVSHIIHINNVNVNQINVKVIHSCNTSFDYGQFEDSITNLTSDLIETIDNSTNKLKSELTQNNSTNSDNSSNTNDLKTKLVNNFYKLRDVVDSIFTITLPKNKRLESLKKYTQQLVEQKIANFTKDILKTILTEHFFKNFTNMAQDEEINLNMVIQVGNRTFLISEHDPDFTPEKETTCNFDLETTQKPTFSTTPTFDFPSVTTITNPITISTIQTTHLPTTTILTPTITEINQLIVETATEINELSFEQTTHLPTTTILTPTITEINQLIVETATEINELSFE
jgi:hypothetical protein